MANLHHNAITFIVVLINRTFEQLIYIFNTQWFTTVVNSYADTAMQESFGIKVREKEKFSLTLNVSLLQRIHYRIRFENHNYFY